MRAYAILGQNFASLAYGNYKDFGMVCFVYAKSQL